MSLTTLANRRGKRKEKYISSDKDSEMDEGAVFRSTNSESYDTGNKKEMHISSDEDSKMDDEPVFDSGSTPSSDISKEALMESMTSMSEEEMNQHLKLCMKLSVENKINMKNAFGLHLIGIMQKLVKKSDKTDIQQASLSLQASSKIFAGRVEALYKDTITFHGHLQSIVSDGKKAKKNDVEDEADGDNAGDDSEKGQIKSQKNKCKSFLKSEESLDFDGDMPAPLIGEPHGNFSALNLAFSTSRLNPKLLSTLQISNDSCTLKCAIPEKCFKEENQLTSVPFGVTPKLESLLEKLKKLDVSQSQFQTLLAASNTSGPRSTLNASTPRTPSSPASLFDDNDGDVFLAPSTVTNTVVPRKSEDIEYAREKFDVMNITADIFVNDIFDAVTNNGLDQRLLAPNSAVKKVLDRSKRSSIKPSEGRSTKKKVKEPFFAGKSAKNIKGLFVIGSSTCISQKVLSEWSAEATSNFDFGYKLSKSIETRKEQDPEYAVTLDEVLRVIKQNDLQYHFKYYFNKLSQVWKFSRRKLCLDDSLPGIDFANQTEKRMASLGGGAINNPESLALSFQNLSIHDSMHEELPNSGEKNPVNEEDLGPGDDPAVSDPEDQVFDLPEPFETDIEQLMVKPPELVRPNCMKYDKRPVNLNTEKIKDLMWKIISKSLEVNNSSVKEAEQFVLFSAIYEELKIKLEREISEFISMQFAFVVLLILANEKVLLIENVNDNTDLSINQDLSEIEVAENM